jgi:hypothetical protein
MAAEPAELRAAREHLSRAEATFRADDGLFHLEEALALLDKIGASEDSTHRTIARNLASTYALKLFGAIRRLVQTDPGLPEPELERFFRIVLAFDDADVELPTQAASIKIELVRRLIDRSYEGYSPEEKRKAVERLEEIAAGGGKRRTFRGSKKR